MANVTPGQLWQNRGYRTSLGVAAGSDVKHLHKSYSTNASAPGSGHRAYGGLLWGATNGIKTISGHTKFVGVPASRRVLLIRQGPPAFIIGEFVTQAYTGVFSFTGLAPGKYIVLDLDSAKQGLIYDLVEAGP